MVELVDFVVCKSVIIQIIGIVYIASVDDGTLFYDPDENQDDGMWN